jgi:hypothetical protein
VAVKRFALVAALVVVFDAVIGLFPRTLEEWWGGLYVGAAAILTVAVAAYAAVLVVMRIKRSSAEGATPERGADHCVPGLVSSIARMGRS